jgi:hypothetical protein
MVFLPPDDRRYLTDKGVVFEEVEGDGQKGIILRNYPLPAGHFDIQVADILILLPAGYPDIPPDMFHTLPWVRLASNNQYPNRADQKVEFADQTWQRWSRHNKEWRAGVDGIWTMLKRVDNALLVAA